jgi:rod shape-determining protein MreC
MHNNKKGETIGIIITIIILILLVMISNNKLSNMSFLEKTLNTIVMPIQNGYTYLKNKIAGNNNFFANIDTLSEENDDLKKKNSELEQELRELEIIKAENQTLKEYLDLTEKYNSYITIPAYIINKDISNYSNTFVINVGTDDGVEENMTVIADKGLVGHVISVSQNTSKVETIIDTSSSTSITFSSTGDKAICKGTLSSQELKVEFISTTSTILENDTIETSGMGGIYPKGITIGTVSKIIETKNSTDRYALITPAVDFDNLETVLVIKK